MYIQAKLNEDLSSQQNNYVTSFSKTKEALPVHSGLVTSHSITSSHVQHEFLFSKPQEKKMLQVEYGFMTLNPSSKFHIQQPIANL